MVENSIHIRSIKQLRKKDIYSETNLLLQAEAFQLEQAGRNELSPSKIDSDVNDTPFKSILLANLP